MEECFPSMAVVSLCATFATSSRLERLPADSSSLFHWLAHVRVACPPPQARNTRAAVSHAVSHCILSFLLEEKS